MAENDARGIYAVVGATGSAGAAVKKALEMRGHEVRLIARRAGVSLDDVHALERAFKGIDGAYLMIPFDLSAPDLHARETQIATTLAAAVRNARVRRVVLLSGLSAHLGKATVGSAWGAAMMEERLGSLAIPELTCLRAGFFMENLLQGAAQIVETGTFGWAFAPDRPMPMIAAADVGERAAALLESGGFDGRAVHELLGSRDYTLAEAVQILGTALGRPDARYVQVPYAEAREGMIRAGMSASFADAVMITARSFNEGQVWAQEPRNSANTTPTTLEQFAASFAKQHASTQ
jgi:uncharacterized protein YbjT (DUF2867 family)